MEGERGEGAIYPHLQQYQGSLALMCWESIFPTQKWEHTSNKENRKSRTAVCGHFEVEQATWMNSHQTECTVMPSPVVQESTLRKVIRLDCNCL